MELRETLSGASIFHNVRWRLCPFWLLLGCKKWWKGKYLPVEDLASLWRGRAHETGENHVAGQWTEKVHAVSLHKDMTSPELSTTIVPIPQLCPCIHLCLPYNGHKHNSRERGNYLVLIHTDTQTIRRGRERRPWPCPPWVSLLQNSAHPEQEGHIGHFLQGCAVSPLLGTERSSLP